MKKKIHRAVEELEADGALEGPGAFAHTPNLCPSFGVQNVISQSSGLSGLSWFRSSGADLKDLGGRIQGLR